MNPLMPVSCPACACAFTIELPRAAPIAAGSCPRCRRTAYVSRYRRIDIGLSEVCNLTCNMCRRPQEKAFMAFSRVERLLTEARDIGVRTISFSGGEPFVHPRFLDILRTALGLALDVELVTNGTLVRAADIPILEGLKCMTVSIDGTRDVHDHIRGKQGAYDRTLETLRMLASSSVQWGTNTVIQACNADVLLDNWRAIRAVGRPSYVGLTHVEVVPETAHLQPSAAQHTEIRRQLAAIRDECVSEHIHFNDEPLLMPMYEIFADKSRRYRPLDGCTIPQTFLGISNYGVFPCWHQGRSIQSDGLIDALESDLCREIVAEGLERRCVGCNAANYSWSPEWIEGIAAAAAAREWDDGVVYLSAGERETGSLSAGRKTLPLLERRRVHEGRAR